MEMETDLIASSLPLILGTLAILVLWLFAWVIRLQIRMKRLLSGKDGRSLEDAVLSLKRGMGELSAARKDIEEYILNLRAMQKKNISRLQTIRFNPFRGDGSGGNQSFAAAMSDEEGNGIIFSGLYSRERMNVYAKPLKKFASEIPLSEEEKEVLEKIKK